MSSNQVTAINGCPQCGCKDFRILTVQNESKDTPYALYACNGCVMAYSEDQYVKFGKFSTESAHDC